MTDPKPTTHWMVCNGLIQEVTLPPWTPQDTRMLLVPDLSPKECRELRRRAAYEIVRLREP